MSLCFRQLEAARVKHCHLKCLLPGLCIIVHVTGCTTHGNCVHSWVRGDTQHPAASCVPSSTGPGAHVEPTWPYVGPVFLNNVHTPVNVGPALGLAFYVMVSVSVKHHGDTRHSAVLYALFSLASPYSRSMGSTWPNVWPIFLFIRHWPRLLYCWVGDSEKRQNTLQTHSATVCHAPFLGVKS